MLGAWLGSTTSQKGTLCSPQLQAAGAFVGNVPSCTGTNPASMWPNQAAPSSSRLWAHPRSCRKGASPRGTLQGGAHICGQMVLRTPELGLEVGNSFLPVPLPSSAGLPGHVIGSLYLLILAIKQSSSVRNPVRAFDSCSCDSQQL